MRYVGPALRALLWFWVTSGLLGLAASQLSSENEPKSLHTILPAVGVFAVASAVGLLIFRRTLREQDARRRGFPLVPTNPHQP